MDGRYRVFGRRERHVQARGRTARSRYPARRSVRWKTRVAGDRASPRVRSGLLRAPGPDGGSLRERGGQRDPGDDDLRRRRVGRGAATGHRTTRRKHRKHRPAPGETWLGCWAATCAFVAAGTNATLGACRTDRPKLLRSHPLAPLPEKGYPGLVAPICLQRRRRQLLWLMFGARTRGTSTRERKSASASCACTPR